MKIWMLSSLLWIAVTAQATDTGPNGQFDSTSSASTNQEKALILKNVKPRPDPAEDRESSSYMGDPDPLDPLKVKNESIKEVENLENNGNFKTFAIEGAEVVDWLQVAGKEGDLYVLGNPNAPIRMVDYSDFL